MRRLMITNIEFHYNEEENNRQLTSITVHFISTDAPFRFNGKADLTKAEYGNGDLEEIKVKVLDKSLALFGKKSADLD